MRADKNDCTCLPNGHGVWYVCEHSTPAAQQAVQADERSARQRMANDPTFWDGVPGEVRDIFEALIGVDRDSPSRFIPSS